MLIVLSIRSPQNGIKKQSQNLTTPRQPNLKLFRLMKQIYFFYLFTWNFVSPSLKKALICLAAAMPALVLASAVCAPIFFGVEK